MRGDKIIKLHDKKVSIVFSVDEKYLQYVSVAINSLVKKSTKCYIYDIYIIYTGIELNRLHKLKKITKSRSNIIINFVDIKYYLEDAIKQHGNIFYEKSYFTTAMYYRFFIPKIFYNFDRVVYCDSDMLFKKDISELFHIDLKGNAIAACKDIAVLYSYRKRSEIWQQNIGLNLDKIGLFLVPNYINSGLIIFDINKCNKIQSVDRCLNVLKNFNNLYLPDQDVLNIVFQNNIYFLHLKWNFLWTIDIECKQKPLYLSQQAIKEINEAKTDPGIIHYISETKPWKDKNKFFSEWWKIAHESIFYGEILYSKLAIQNSYINIAQNDYIYVDILDYLLLLPYFNLDDLYRFIEQVYSLENFVLYRKRAINQATVFYQKKTFFLSNEEIYFFMIKEFAHIKDVEERLIKQCSYLNQELFQILKFLDSLGKKIILINNSVYSKQDITEVLQKNGFDFYEDIYSAESFQEKDHDVFLYFGKFLFDIQRIDPKKYHFRYASPKDEFLKHNPKLCMIYNNESLEASIVLGLYIKKWILNDKYIDNYWEVFGYFYGGPLCYGLASFVYNQAIKNDLKEFVFVARDGYVIEKIFNFLQQQFKTNIRTEYVYASRALKILSDIDLRADDLPWDNKISSLFDLCVEALSSFKKYKHKVLSKKIQLDLLRSNLYTIRKLSIEIEKSFVKYIDNFSFKQGKIGIFDFVSFEFSSLRILRSVLKKNFFYAYYFYIMPNAKKTFLFNFAKTCSYSPVFFKNHLIGEFLVTAPELPISFIKDEQINRVYNTYERHKVEIYKIISKYELEFSRDLISTFGDFKISFRSSKVIEIINCFIDNMDYKDRYYFKDIYHSENSAHTKYVKIFNEYTSAVDVVKNSLSYKIGLRIIQSKTVGKILTLPFSLINIIYQDHIEKKIGDKLKSINVNFGNQSIDECYDFIESEKIKRHLAYQLGECFLKHPIMFIFYSVKIYIKWKNNEK
ncbi:glycosyltransferase [Campylobacter sp. IFREMER_LSEM_CL1904]|uniref:glycosyltransferase n=1 Tax=unclassified Campylobacter TaxID=2593542 RepID=UPI0039925AE8